MRWKDAHAAAVGRIGRQRHDARPVQTGAAQLGHPVVGRGDRARRRGQDRLLQRAYGQLAEARLCGGQRRGSGKADNLVRPRRSGGDGGCRSPRSASARPGAPTDTSSHNTDSRNTGMRRVAGAAPRARAAGTFPGSPAVCRCRGIPGHRAGADRAWFRRDQGRVERGHDSQASGGSGRLRLHHLDADEMLDGVVSPRLMIGHRPVRRRRQPAATLSSSLGITPSSPAHPRRDDWRAVDVHRRQRIAVDEQECGPSASGAARGPPADPSTTPSHEYRRRTPRWRPSPSWLVMVWGR